MALEKISDIVMTTMTRQTQSKTKNSRGSTWQNKTHEENVVHYITSNEGKPEDNPPEPVICEYCGKPRYTKGFSLGNKIHWLPFAERCTCEEATEAYEREQREKAEKEQREREEEAARRMRQRVERIIGQSGINARFLRRTFATFEETPGNAVALRACKNYVNNFNELLPSNNSDPGRNGLFIAGAVGTGKTHLAASVANQLMSKGTAVICMTMIDLLERIKRTYEKNKGSESEVLTLYKTVPLLIIDDMGKEPATEWGISKIYAIINGRYEAYMPTIVTTNYSDTELVKKLTPPKSGDDITAAATIDRLREMCNGIVLDGNSWRSR